MYSTTVDFRGGRTARLVRASEDTTPEEVLHALGLERPKALFIVIGGAAEMAPDVGQQLAPLLREGLVAAGKECGAQILDGGTQSGVMEVMGQAVAARGRTIPLIGVAPAGRVTYPGAPSLKDGADTAPLEPNHTHFALAPGDAWGAETDLMYGLAAVLGQGIPLVSVLVNGGKVAEEEVVRSIALGSPTVVVEGSGRLADRIAKRLHARRAGPSPSKREGSLDKIVRQGRIVVFPIDGEPQAFKELLLHEVR